MKTLLKIFILGFLVSLCGPATATALNSLQFPAELKFNEKPIDPLCYFSPDLNKDLLDLNNCGLAKEKYQMTEISQELSKKGFYGFDWKEAPVPEQSFVFQGYSYYKAWEAGNHQYWIYAINSGGGSGHFSSIYLTKRIDSTTVEMKSIAGGDRCNGGIHEAWNRGDNLEFSINLTATDLLTLGENNPNNPQTYDDLADCLICCVAKAHYSVDTQAEPKLLFVDLGKDTEIFKTEEGGAQKCLNKLLLKYVTQGKSELNKEELVALTKEFNQSCRGKDTEGIS